MDDRPTKLDVTDARQAKTGLGVRYVLLVSLGLIVVAGIIIYAFVK